MNLTNEEIQIKIAESLGYTQIHKANGGFVNAPMGCSPSNKALVYLLPNYPESLDACAEFENHAYRTEPSGWLARYEDELRERCSVLQYPHYNPICATPSQRCLAYLKTKNLIP